MAGSLAKVRSLPRHGLGASVIGAIGVVAVPR
jgi:hypothetical protein